MSTAENRALIRHIYAEIVNGKNLALVSEYYASDYTFHGPDSVEVKGQEGMKQLLSMYFDAFPDLHLTIDDQIAEDDQVVTRWTARGTQNGQFGTLAPTGRQATVMGALVSRIADGKVAEDWEHFDNLHLLQQLGAAPA
jgi:steroid delta-isomerase-like uncharacterized protein